MRLSAVIVTAVIAAGSVACGPEKTSDRPRPVKGPDVVTVAPDRPDTHTSREA